MVPTDPMLTSDTMLNGIFISNAASALSVEVKEVVISRQIRWRGVQHPRATPWDYTSTVAWHPCAQPRSIAQISARTLPLCISSPGCKAPRNVSLAPVALCTLAAAASACADANRTSMTRAAQDLSLRGDALGRCASSFSCNNTRIYQIADNRCRASQANDPGAFSRGPST
jgi:hypothetical protein